MDFGAILAFPTVSAQIYILFYIIKNFARVADQTIPSKCLCFTGTVTAQHNQSTLSFHGWGYYSDGIRLKFECNASDAF